MNKRLQTRHEYIQIITVRASWLKRKRKKTQKPFIGVCGHILKNHKLMNLPDHQTSDFYQIIRSEERIDCSNPCLFMVATKFHKRKFRTFSHFFQDIREAKIRTFQDNFQEMVNSSGHRSKNFRTHTVSGN